MGDRQRRKSDPTNLVDTDSQPGIQRDEAFAKPGRWAGTIDDRAGGDGWHHHGDATQSCSHRPNPTPTTRCAAPRPPSVRHGSSSSRSGSPSISLWIVAFVNDADR